MKYSECTPVYACAVIREILDGQPARDALDMVRAFLDGQATVEEVLLPECPEFP
jgi:hypothetical protein